MTSVLSLSRSRSAPLRSLSQTKDRESDWSWRSFLIACCLLIVQSANGATVPPERPSPLFPTDRLLTVNVTMAPADWAALRIEHRVSDFVKIAENPYHYYRATVEIGGTKLQDVGIRKKGFIGSAISTRPSIKLNLGKYVKGRTLDGLDMLTLNNDLQDESFLNQHLTYRFMNEAGVPAPQTCFAKVTVNGEDLGIYTHVESIERSFFKHHFQSSKGRIYEGYAGDFDGRDTMRIVLKDGKEKDSQKRIKELSEILLADGPVDLDRIAPFLDLDRFLKFWAAEVLIGHWDGYANNRNNFYLYEDPRTGQFLFVPWGADNSFTRRTLADPNPPLANSVRVEGFLCRRLWEREDVRKRYQATLRNLLEDHWDEASMNKEIDRVVALIEPHLTSRRQEMAEDVARIRTFIGVRRAEILRELDGKTPIQLGTSRSTRNQQRNEQMMTVMGTFQAPLHPAIPPDPFKAGQGQLEFVKDGESERLFIRCGAYLRPEDPEGRPGYPVLTLLASDPDGKKSWKIAFSIDPHQIKLGEAMPIGMFNVAASMSQCEGMEERFRRGSDGLFFLERYPRDTGDLIEGRFEIRVRVF